MEKVNTVQQVEIAERDKQTALIEIRKKAEGKAISVQLTAEDEKHASVEKALAIIKTAEVEADRTRIVGQGSDIKILHIDGLTGNSCNDGNGNGSSDKSSTTDQVVNSALRYRGVAPLLDAVLKEVGISGANLHDMTELAKIAFGQSNGSADNT